MNSGTQPWARKESMSRKAEHIVISGGGTGGHLSPMIAVAQELERKGLSNILLAGTSTGMDKQFFEQHSFPYVLLPSRKNRRILFIPITAFFFAYSTLKSIKLLHTYNACLVACTGGYAGAAAAFAASFLRIPVVLLEQNTIPGRTIRMLSRISRTVFCQFKVCADTFGEKGIHCGNPLRREMLEKLQSGALDIHNRNTILVMGGSQGARSINRVFLEGMKTLAPVLQHYSIVHLSGRYDEKELREKYKAFDISARVLAFTHNVTDIYSNCRLFIGRAGASSMAEYTAWSIPSLLIPYPWAKDNHQLENARELKKAGACEYITEKELTPDILRDKIQAILTNRECFRKMSTCASDYARPDAGKVIAEHILEIMERQRA